jgi:uncharacterized protein involved in tolerance to divalent cations
MDYALVLVTLPATVAAEPVVRDLLARRLIAGANIIPNLATIYIDGGPPVAMHETLYLCRTQPEHVDAIRLAIEAHTGEREFEVSVVAATAGNSRYAAWIARALASPAGASEGGR